MVIIKDIVRNLGISYLIVFRCLNNNFNVFEKIKKKVVEEVNRLGFYFNVNVRNLVKKEINRIGVIFLNNFNY